MCADQTLTLVGSQGRFCNSGAAAQRSQWKAPAGELNLCCNDNVKDHCPHVRRQKGLYSKMHVVQLLWRSTSVFANQNIRAISAFDRSLHIVLAEG